VMSITAACKARLRILKSLALGIVGSETMLIAWMNSTAPIGLT
jgi:hypothetical protein